VPVDRIAADRVTRRAPGTPAAIGIAAPGGSGRADSAAEPATSGVPAATGRPRAGPVLRASGGLRAPPTRRSLWACQHPPGGQPTRAGGAATPRDPGPGSPRPGAAGADAPPSLLEQLIGLVLDAWSGLELPSPPPGRLSPLVVGHRRPATGQAGSTAPPAPGARSWPSWGRTAPASRPSPICWCAGCRATARSWPCTVSTWEAAHRSCPRAGSCDGCAARQAGIRSRLRPCVASRRGACGVPARHGRRDSALLGPGAAASGAPRARPGRPLRVRRPAG
jgi:hypothetical protein